MLTHERRLSGSGGNMHWSTGHGAAPTTSQKLVMRTKVAVCMQEPIKVIVHHCSVDAFNAACSPHSVTQTIKSHQQRRNTEGDSKSSQGQRLKLDLGIRPSTSSGVGIRVGSPCAVERGATHSNKRKQRTDHNPFQRLLKSFRG